MAYCDVGYARQQILSVYPGRTWRYKVERMSDNQIIAIYYKFLESGKFNRPKPTTKKDREYIPQQLTFEDILNRG